MRGSPIRVLLIEDNPGDARLIREMLREAPGRPFELEEAGTLADGLERLARGGIEAVLLDLGLPDSRGLETFLQARAAFPEVPYIVLTGLDDAAVALRAAHDGAQDYFVKGEIEGAMLWRGIRYAIERKQAETAVRESEERLRLVVSNSPVVLFALDREGTFTLSEGKGLAALGLQPGEALDRSVFEMFQDYPEIIANMKRALSGESFTAEVDLNGIAYETHHAPILDPSGTMVGMIGVATDITDRKQAEETLKRTVSELEAFSYSVSHDLKEPLRTLEAFSQFLLEDHADRLNEEGRDYLARIGRASARLKQMIEDLLLLSRMGRRPEAVERVSVGGLAADAVAAMQVTVEETGAVVEVEDGLPDIEGDVPHVQQIFGNLIANALKFNRREHPLVKVGLKSVEAEMATFYVRDDGIGIDPEYHEQIFRVFQRLHKREEYDGTGAGLTIVKRAAEAIGGQVWLESRPGEGTTFFVALPLWQSGERSVEAQAA